MSFLCDIPSSGLIIYLFITLLLVVEVVHIHRTGALYLKNLALDADLETSDDRLSGLFSARHETPLARRSRSTKIVRSEPFRLSLGQKVGNIPQEP